MVQDVKVLSTEQTLPLIAPVLLRRSLKALAGASHGRTAKAWRAWWKTHDKRLPAKA